MLPCLSVGGGVKLNYPLVPRTPGTFAGAPALSVLLRRVGAVYACRWVLSACTVVRVHGVHGIPTFMEAFSIKINTEGSLLLSSPLLPL